MSGTLITLFLLGSLAITRQVVAGCECELKSDGIITKNVVQSLLELRDLLFIHFDDCEDAFNKGFSKSGVYRIKPKTSFRPFKVWCDMESDGGGWTVIQTRFDGLVDFYRAWKEYRNGFGSVDSEHWLGNNFIRHITQDNDYQLKIDLTGFKENEIASAKYSPFHIGSEDEKYKLYFGNNFTSTGGILNYFSCLGSSFTTKDNDNDDWHENCADLGHGAGWYSACFACNLNGMWMTEGQSMATRGIQSFDNKKGIIWADAFGVEFYSLKSVEMKVRKIRNNC